MKVCAIICEYNPFHTGHEYQISEAKKSFDAVIAIMSGSFTQRGEPAIFDKFTRAKAAVIGGADLVLELPTCYVLSPAQLFARGGVRIAEATGVTDTLVFGAENADIEKLKEYADIMLEPTEEMRLELKRLLKSGMSHPAAIEKAYSQIPADVLRAPNTILALEYIKELKNTNIEPFVIKRSGSGYHESEKQDGHPSATYVRKVIRAGGDYKELVPCGVSEVFKQAEACHTERLYPILKYKLRASGSDGFDFAEGLENRIVEQAFLSGSFSELLENVKTKRYTSRRILRTVMSYMLGFGVEMSKKEPEYLRVLAANKTGCELLGRMKKSATLPIITKPKDFAKESQMLRLDMLASDLRSMGCDKGEYGSDYKKSPFILNS